MPVRPTSFALLLGASLVSTATFAQAPPPAPDPPPAAAPTPPPPAPAQPALPAPPTPPPSTPAAPPMAPTPPPSGPSAAEVPPMEAAPRPEGVTAKGLPFSQRGALFADVAALRIEGANKPVAAIDIIARVPLTERTFFDAVLPIGFGAVGNPMVGVHHVFRPADRLWINLGGAFGVPLVSTTGFDGFQRARAFWDLQEFSRYTMPFVLRFGLEAHVGIAEFRVQVEPAWGVSVKRGTLNGQNHLVAFQHAVEAQLGHAIGGGVRLQGVAIPTKTIGSSPDYDHYQGAVELFFRVYRDPIFARVGFVIPIDNPLGEVNNTRTWGVRAQTGWSFD